MNRRKEERCDGAKGKANGRSDREELSEQVEVEERLEQARKHCKASWRRETSGLDWKT